MWGVFKNEASLQPHRSRYWLNANPDDPVAFEQQVNTVCQLHLQAQELLTQRVHVVSTDLVDGYPGTLCVLIQANRCELDRWS